MKYFEFIKEFTDILTKKISKLGSGLELEKVGVKLGDMAYTLLSLKNKDTYVAEGINCLIPYIIYQNYEHIDQIADDTLKILNNECQNYNDEILSSIGEARYSNLLCKKSPIDKRCFGFISSDQNAFFKLYYLFDGDLDDNDVPDSQRAMYSPVDRQFMKHFNYNSNLLHECAIKNTRIVENKLKEYRKRRESIETRE